MPEYHTIFFPSSGDPEEDAREAALIALQQQREAAGLCPNGCGPITVDSDTERHCEVCHFHGATFQVSAEDFLGAP